MLPFDTQNEYIKAEGHEQAKRGTHICGMPLSVSNGSPGRTRIPLKAGLTATLSMLSANPPSSAFQFHAS
jgi:hypothetical protein